MILDPAAVRVGRLRIRAGGRDLSLLGRAVGRRVGAAEIEPPSLPPSAILVVRRIAARGRAVHRGRSGEAPLRPFDAALRAGLERACGTAARPRDGDLPPGAEAVLFADEAELLACLALDLARHRHRERWWWGTLLAAGEPRLAALLAARARLFPAIVATLATWGRVPEVMATLMPAEIDALATAIVQEHGLAAAIAADPLWRETARPAAMNPPVTPSRPTTWATANPQGMADAVALSDAPAPPWRAWAPAAALTGLLPAAEALVGIALTLHGAPQRAGAPLFAMHFGTWSHGVRAAPAVSRLPLLPPPRGREKASSFPRPLRARAGPRARTRGVRVEGVSASRTIDPGPAEPRGATTPDIRVPRVEPAGDVRVSAAEGEAPAKPEWVLADGDGAIGASPPTAADSGAASIIADAGAGASAGGPAPLAFAGGIETALGGLFHLINLFDYLDLPACFEGEWRLGEQLGPWALLELVGRALLDEMPAEDACDPVWRILAALDGREAAVLPGADFRGADAFRLPAAWARAVASGDEPSRWRAGDGQLRLWSEAGYVLADVPRTALAPDQQVAGELRACGRAESRVPAGEAASWEPVPLAPLRALRAHGLAGDLARWLGLVVPYLHRRLALALGVDQPALELLRRPARLYVSPSHIDLIAGLDSISLALRRSGLDRDPGWLPRFGRVVLFHFQ